LAPGAEFDAPYIVLRCNSWLYPEHREVVAVQRYKFQGLLTVDPPPQHRAQGGTGGHPAPRPAFLPTGVLQRMVVSGEHRETHATRIFSALVATSADGAAVQDGNHVIVTISLFCNDPGDYFRAGAEFALWQGRDVGHGVVTHRLFV
jgi:hypothetical protein